MPRFMAWAIMLGGLLLAGCAAGDRQPDPESSEVAGQADRAREQPASATAESGREAVAAACAAFVERGLVSLGETRADLFSAIGSPDSITAIPVPNQFVEGQIDTVFRLRYDGLTVFVDRVSGGPEFISSVVVTNDRYLTVPGIRIGMTWEELVARLGEPKPVGDDLFEYNCGPSIGPDEPVSVRIRDGRVEEIHFTYYTG